MLFTTWGPTRGGCGHAHKTYEAAKRCRAKDRNGCKGQGGYSDRVVRAIVYPHHARRFDAQRGPGGGK